MPMRILTIVLLTLSLSACVSTKEKNCTDNGGSWQRVCFAQNYFCVMPHPDACKSCDSSSDCNGECIAVKDSAGQVTGQCSEDNNPCGCWDFYNNGKAAGALCSD